MAWTNHNIYAAYRGGEYLGKGTVGEITTLVGVSRKTVQIYASPSGTLRAKKRNKRNTLMIVLLSRDCHPARNKNIYAAYRGDDYIGEGTLDDIAALAGVSRKTAQWCARPAALRRIEERSKAWDAGERQLKTRGSLVLVLVEEVNESRTG